MRKQTVYYPEAGDLLRRFFTLAELQDFVKGIADDHPGTDPNEILLHISDLKAEVVEHR